MDAALDGLLPALGLDGGGIYVLDEPNGDLKVARYRGVSSEYVREVARFSRGEAFVGSALEGEAPVVVPDLSTLPGFEELTRAAR